MILDANLDNMWELYDVHGNKLNYVVWANTETGEVEELIFTRHGFTNGTQRVKYDAPLRAERIKPENY